MLIQRLMLVDEPLISLLEFLNSRINNEFTKHLGLVGTPLKIEFKGGTNPFADKKNKLSQRQVNKKRRLMSWKKKKKDKK
jgi:GTP-binding protein